MKEGEAQRYYTPTPSTHAHTTTTDQRCTGAWAVGSWVGGLGDGESGGGVGEVGREGVGEVGREGGGTVAKEGGRGQLYHGLDIPSHGLLPSLPRLLPPSSSSPPAPPSLLAITFSLPFLLLFFPLFWVSSPLALPFSPPSFALCLPCLSPSFSSSKSLLHLNLTTRFTLR